VSLPYVAPREGDIDYDTEFWHRAGTTHPISIGAVRDADAQADLAEDRIEAGDYEHETTTVEQDQDLLDEYAAILALSVAAEPQAAREDIGYSLKALYRHGWRA